MKDKHEIPKPATHHKITCKRCKKEVNTLVKYTRLCRVCRGHRIMVSSNSSYWKIWDAIY